MYHALGLEQMHVEIAPIGVAVHQLHAGLRKFGHEMAGASSTSRKYDSIEDVLLRLA
jgi:hypothetical protein